ncbi:hypothetical protein NDU88_000429 [Pleurodeles waltl]|uniref:Uncharacterized protein n=1 Tax=Pleurodeles waltl TaxID=8319 RepID=A0AAV7V526_PLEWA|nr:hypothetical protein NDU88_000429 [Pleurodeles waltl]
MPPCLCSASGALQGFLEHYSPSREEQRYMGGILLLRTGPAPFPWPGLGGDTNPEPPHAPELEMERAPRLHLEKTGGGSGSATRPQDAERGGRKQLPPGPRP